jgi:hypothetical protein
MKQIPGAAIAGTQEKKPPSPVEIPTKDNDF